LTGRYSPIKRGGACNWGTPVLVDSEFLARMDTGLRIGAERLSRLTRTGLGSSGREAIDMPLEVQVLLSSSRREFSKELRPSTTCDGTDKRTFVVINELWREKYLCAP